MTYAEDLLKLAQELAGQDADNQRQACYRRAVSTAYYALFHLLITEATLNWANVEMRLELGRVFEHGKMRAASSRQKSAILEAHKNVLPTDVTRSLLFVAETFITLQQRRHEADYDLGKIWSRTEVQTLLDEVSKAFAKWNQIRHEPAAQAYLVSLLGTRARTE